MKRLLIMMLITALAFFLMIPSVLADQYKMTMTNEVAASHWKTTLMKDLGEMIEERSEGQIKTKVHSGGALYTDKSAIEALGTGSVQMVWPVSVNVEPFSLDYGVINLPFAISDDLILKNPGFREDLGDLLSDTLAKEQFQVLGLLRADELVFVFKDARPKTVDDLKGLKVRVIGGQVLLDWVGELGLTPISMPASEFTTALAQGVIDGIHTSSDGWASMIGDLGEYGLLIPEYCIVTYSVLIDSNWLNKLPEDLREIVISSVDEIAAEQWQYSLDKAEESYDIIKNEFNSDVYKVPENEIPEWAEKVDPAYGRFAEKYPEVFDRFVELNKKYGREWPPKE